MRAEVFYEEKTAMKWRKYTIHTLEGAEEPISGMLYDMGITAVEIEDKVPVPPEASGNLFGDVVPQMPENDPTASISFYTEWEDERKDADRERALLTEVHARLQGMRAFLDIGEGTITTDETEDTDWINRWKEYFHRFYVDDIEIIPSWEEENADPDAKMVLRIDPGTAFGTGKHETTQLAIRQLRKTLEEEKYGRAGAHVLDIGTGSGILGIIALKSGASFVYGTDIDPVAFPALEENLARNDLEHASFTRALQDVITDENAREAVRSASKGGYDIVTANIIAEILTSLTPFVPSFLRDGGIYITSGILREKEEMVRKAIEDAGLEVAAVTYQGEWCSVTAKKPVRHYRYFQNRECEYFPCHEGADPDNFNCLFCYCPMHFLGAKCPGTPHFTEKGVKDCTGCDFPHLRENYDTVIEVLRKNKYFG